MQSIKNYPYKIILGSKSPRRQELLESLGFIFDVALPDADESYPPQLQAEEIPLYIARKKALSFDFSQLPSNTLIITADTLVIFDNEILGKPKDREEAIRMLYNLSGQTHEVITGVCLRSANKEECFSAHSKVTFRVLSFEEIEYYVDTCKPFDKAGSYGIQEWIGYTALERLEGSFFNVMGLPTQMLYKALMAF